jgi:hypothetical protein
MGELIKWIRMGDESKEKKKSEERKEKKNDSRNVQKSIGTI